MTRGSALLEAGGVDLQVPQGGSALIRASDPGYGLSGSARVFRATAA